ncbi:MAG: DUF4252 domain-containing protein [Bryobacteraceae bacterium]|jgi:hypothetical protein
MKTTWVGVIICAAVTGAAWGQALDLSSLDKLGDKAKESNIVTLDQGMLKLAAGFLNDHDKDQQAAKALIGGLKAVYVRNFEFSSKDQYSMADIEPIRKQIHALGWSKIVESKEKNDDGSLREIDEVYINTGAGGGLAVIAAEPKELSIVYIDGVLKLEDLQKLHGRLGLPDIDIQNDGKDHPEKDKK